VRIGRVLVCLEHITLLGSEFHHREEIIGQNENHTNCPVHKLKVADGVHIFELEAEKDFLQRFSVSDLHVASLKPDKSIALVHLWHLDH